MNKKNLTGLVAVLMLAGCGGAAQNDAAPNIKDPSEKLLAGKGQWSLVEDEKSADPLARNIAARATVHPQGETYSAAAMPAEKAKPDEQIDSPSDPLGSMNFRVLRLERQMVDLRRDVDTLRPAIGGVAQPSVSDIPSKTEHMAASRTTITRVIKGLRAGDHPGKTRIVLDISASGAYTAKIENAGRQLILNLPDASWAGPEQDRLKTTLAEGYAVEASPSGGSIVTVSLIKPARIASDMILPPSGETGPRIVIDLAPE